MRAVPASALFVAAAAAAMAAPTSRDPRLRLDQFGYRPGDAKVAVIAEPRLGFDAPDPIAPGATCEIRRWADDAPVLTAAATPWRAGATHAQSGDGAWWLDFSALTAPGSYYVHCPAASASSGRFEIAEDVHLAVLEQAVRSFYYQRCGTAKPAATAGAAWADPACHVGAGQDLACPPVVGATPAQDLHGGWHDAGDYNKYVNFADDVIHDLSAAFEERPGAFGDATGIPESGNGVPDLLDEMRWELEWLLRMQLPDGSVLHKVSVADWSAASPPSADAAPRLYAEPTASATISACGAFAHAAIAFRSCPVTAAQDFAAVLEAAALAAWAWLDANPGRIPSTYANVGFSSVACEDDAYQQDANRTCASAYLFALTQDARFRTYFEATYQDVHLMEWRWAFPFESGYQDGLLAHAATPGASSAVADDIRSAYGDSVAGTDHWAHVSAGDDAYRGYLPDGWYVWGSNRVKAQEGLLYLQALRHGRSGGRDQQYRDAAAGYAHWLHGVNPLGRVMLSAMEPWGAELSVHEFYHSWFADGTDWDDAASSLHGPAPGFLTGGVNQFYQPDAAYAGPPIEPPEAQPVQKSYLDWNTSWPENSWEVTENAIGYQASYVRLLASFVPDASCPLPGGLGDSLRVTRSGSDVVLSWQAGAGATSHRLLRCDASLGSCVPQPHRDVPGTTVTDAADPAMRLWYAVSSVNACGETR